MGEKNPFRTEGSWYKGNLHTHTTNSDGELSPEEVAAWYRDRGYDFLAITDHNKVTEVEGAFPNFLLIKGVEIGVGEAELGQDYHLLCLNISEPPELEEETTAREIIDVVKAKGGEVILGHPYWSSLTIGDFVPLEGILGIEVFNTHCDLAIGKGISSVHWDGLLVRGKRLFGFAVDDTHRFTLPFYAGSGWIMVKAKSPTQNEVLGAIGKGNFYSSCGPIIEDIKLEGNKIEVSCSQAIRINFICNSSKGRSFQAEGDKFLTKAEFSLNEEEYVRVECIDRRGRIAWSNPFFLKR